MVLQPSSEDRSDKMETEGVSDGAKTETVAPPPAITLADLLGYVFLEKHNLRVAQPRFFSAIRDYNNLIPLFQNNLTQIDHI